MSWQLVFTKHAAKDAKKITSVEMRSKIEKLLKILAINPYKTIPPSKKLIGDLLGAYSIRINIQHSLVYQILDDIRTVKIIRMWSHYE